MSAIRLVSVMLALAWSGSGQAQQPQGPSQPALRLTVIGDAAPAVAGPQRCDAADIPDTPARAIRLADGTVQLYATEKLNRLDRGPNLLTLRHDCAVVYQGGGKDDPAAFDDRAWIASPWTADGRTIWAVVHNEFQGQRRPALCPSGRYMDCWYNALTAAVSHDGGRRFERAPGRALVAALPYRYDQVGLGHHGYFNPSNIVSLNGAQYMFAFATAALAQKEGNCLLRTTVQAAPESWRAWDGNGFNAAFIDPYVAPETRPEQHVCTPVGAGVLRWPVTSLVRHEPDGLFVALMLNGARGGGVFYATSPDLVHWSGPALLMPAMGEGGWTCADAPPIAYPSLLDPASTDRNFETVGASAMLYATRYQVDFCHIGMDRALVRWRIRVDS
jgi:hypothetical protein